MIQVAPAEDVERLASGAAEGALAERSHEATLLPAGIDVKRLIIGGGEVNEGFGGFPPRAGS